MSNLWPGKGKKYTGDSKILGIEMLSIDVFHQADIVLGPFGVYIRTIMAEILLAIKEWVKKLCNTAVSITIIKDSMPKSSKFIQTDT